MSAESHWREPHGEAPRPTVQQLSERIYALDAPYDDVWVRTYLVVGETAAFIDTGLGATGAAGLSLLQSLGSPQVTAAIHTHGHWDHIGSAAMIRQATGCLIAAHPDDAAMISSHDENDRRFLRRFPEFPPTEAGWHAVHDRIGPEVRVDVEVTGGERFDLGGGIVLEVIPLPGHTPGCIGIFDRDSGALLTGDSLAGPGPFGTLAQYEDVAAYRDSVARVVSLPVRQLLAAHFEPMDAEAAKGFLAGCLDEVDRIEKCVRTVMESGLDLVALTQKVCHRLSKPFMLQPLFTVTAHLEDLARCTASKG